jgi:proteasome lid subunit RPN8/RPN11
MFQIMSGYLHHFDPRFLEGLLIDEQANSCDDPQSAFVSQRSEGRPCALKMTPSVHRLICSTLVWAGSEQGGLLIGPADEPLVTHFILDDEAVSTATSFEVNAERMNARLRPFLQLGMNCKGIVHSHPPGVTSPSNGDQHYVQRSLANPRNQKAVEFYLPIVCDGCLYPWILQRDEQPRFAQLILV